MRSPSSRSLRSVYGGLKTQLSHGRPARRGLATVINQAPKDPVDYDQITVLPNGLRVATEALPGPFAGVGVYIDAGSRYENEELSGVSHVMDRLAFKSTHTKSSDQIFELMETLGGTMQCSSSREALTYQAASFNDAVPTTLDLLADTIRNPQISEEEVAQQLETAEYEIREIWSKPDLILPEMMNVAAYKDNTLGNPLLCPEERLPYIDQQVVQKYRDAFYHPERMVLAFAGVRHDHAIKLSEQFFGDMKRKGAPTLSQIGEQTSVGESTHAEESAHASTSPYAAMYSTPSSNSSTHSYSSSRLSTQIPFSKNLSTSASTHASLSEASLDKANPNITHIPSHYTGGFLALPKLAAPLNPALPDLTYIHLGFEALSISSDDIYALATLQTLLGGGGSFSAGGPGKGMYSRLYTNVLNQYGWVESCVAFNQSYTDSGIFGISASCEPRQAGQMLEVMCRELHNLTLDSGFSALQPIEVQRAKNQLRSSLLMNLESRMVELEDLGRQIQVHGRRVGVKEMCAKIDSLTIEDLRRVAKTVFRGLVNNPGHGSGAPTVVMQEGSTAPSSLMRWDSIQDRIAKWKLGRR